MKATKKQPKRAAKPRIGGTMKAWFTGNLPDGSSTIHDVQPYRGRYPQWFKWVVTLGAIHTRSGRVEMAVE